MWMGAEEGQKRFLKAADTRLSNLRQEEVKLEMFEPFLAPVLYCCHSASASGVVPKNSPTHSSSYKKHEHTVTI